MKEHFVELYDLKGKKKELQFELYSKKSLLYSIKGVKYDEMPSKSGFSTDISHFIQEIDDINTEIERIEEEVKQLEKKYLIEIKKVTNNSIEQRILFLYYVKQFKLKEIAMMINYSDRHIRRLKHEAVAKYEWYIKYVL